MTDEDDPFADVDAADREGDPFAEMDEPDRDSAADPEPWAGEDPTAAPPREEPSTDDGPAVEPESPAGEDRAGDPLDGVDTPEGDPFTETEAFERTGVGGVDPDRVWAEVTDEDSDLAAAAESRYDEVDKHAFCERCEFFSPPPDVACSHDGTEIVEFLDSDTVRLLNCPIVAERRALERER